jgi:hypothetical protein
MSSLTEQERIGLEEVFLSISSSQNLFHKWRFWRQHFSTLLSFNKDNNPFPIHSQANRWIKNTLNNRKITKLFIKIQKRRKF